MNWRDFFYFSKGERRALIVLVGLITAAWLTLIITDKRVDPANTGNSAYLSVPDSASSALSPDSVSLPSSLQKAKAFILKDNPGIPKKTGKRSYAYTPIEKYPAGTILELNTADTTVLKKIPGIGTTFSNRIIKYRNLLGGFYSVTQLSEVYGIDEDRYQALKEWFTADPQLIRKRSLNTLPADSLYRHPYLSKPQARAILRQRQQKGKLTGWSNLLLLDEFANADKEVMSFYFSFE